MAGEPSVWGTCVYIMAGGGGGGCVVRYGWGDLDSYSDVEGRP